MNEFVKDPDAVLDYEWPWVDWLEEGDSIATHEVEVTAGDVQVDSSTFGGTSVTVWLSGGTAGTDSTVRVSVTTVQGRTDDQSARILIRHR